MSHHHRIIVPAVTDRPTCAGMWEFRPTHTPSEFDPLELWRRTSERDIIAERWWKTALGSWLAWPNMTITVLVTETPGAGRICHELGMGGHALCGLAPWSGRWRKA